MRDWLPLIDAAADPEVHRDRKGKDYNEKFHEQVSGNIELDIRGAPTHRIVIAEFKAPGNLQIQHGAMKQKEAVA